MIAMNKFIKRFGNTKNVSRIRNIRYSQNLAQHQLYLSEAFQIKKLRNFGPGPVGWGARKQNRTGPSFSTQIWNIITTFDTFLHR